MIKPNILVICGRNKRRSRTAEHLFKNDDRFNIRSAGLSPQSNRKISENDLNWADLVLVMEGNQKMKIKKIYHYLQLPEIEVLNIPDDYEFMEDELVATLMLEINVVLAAKYNL
ncbi:protein-tyrosine-phosphatase [Dyadobacter flavalbus]|uniref:Protein-tyrosine-phosphatase n=2 Tax=Dyadobacter flavalbus TaxID=2579942 RepID=A0A5M8Q5Y4_9BACT|nr:protein-tyrosine-phosphatase [Dyadobacter flavalbus]